MRQEPDTLLIREANLDDVEAIVRLHETDALGGHGDVWSLENAPSYFAAFTAIAANSNSSLYVAVADEEIVGTFQLTFIQNLTERGSLRAKVESVQVSAARRSRGIGAFMMAEAKTIALARGAASLELTSNKLRKDAHRFYENLGFVRSHDGFKMRLSPQAQLLCQKG